MRSIPGGYSTLRLLDFVASSGEIADRNEIESVLAKGGLTKQPFTTFTTSKSTHGRRSMPTPAPHKVQRYGWIPDLPDARDHVYAAPRAFMGRRLPAQV